VRLRRYHPMAHAIVGALLAARMTPHPYDRVVAQALARSGTVRTIALGESARPAAGTAAWPREPTLLLDGAREVRFPARGDCCAATIVNDSVRCLLQ
jgi:hypothetical protein